MAYAMMLAGGVGTRMGSDIPKQYLLIDGKPMIMYVLNLLQEHPLIEKVVIVATKEWRDFIDEWMEKGGITKFAGYADPGEDRQKSVRNGFRKLKEIGTPDDMKVMMCEAVRPGVSPEVITANIEAADNYDIVDTILPIHEAIYYSHDGRSMDQSLDRTKVIIGMEPSTVRFGKYYECNESTPDEEMEKYRGSIDFALAMNFTIGTVMGNVDGFKITTQDDLERFEYVVEKRKRNS